MKEVMKAEKVAEPTPENVEKKEDTALADLTTSINELKTAVEKDAGERQIRRPVREWDTIGGVKASCGDGLPNTKCAACDILKNLALPLKLVLGVHKKELPDRIEEALRAAHLWDEVKDRLKDQATSLYGGQQQRLCLARVLALQPYLLLLGEPTASLDYRATTKIEGLLLDLKEKYTLIAVSPSLSQARRLADVVPVLSEGQIVKRISASEFSDHQFVEDLLDEAF